MEFSITLGPHEILFFGQSASVCHFGVGVEKKWRSFRVNLEITSALSFISGTVEPNETG